MPPGRAVTGYLFAVAITALATAVAWLMRGRETPADVVMLYLLGVVIASIKFDFRVSIATALLGVLAFDLVFVPPYLTLTVSDWRHAVTFGVMLLVAVVIAGLTQRVRNEAEVARALGEAQDRAALERLRSTLLSGISHDFRTPLAVMKGTASTLLEDDATLSPAARKELLSTLLDECDHLERLVHNVLTLTRLESGEVRVRRELQSAEELVGGALRRVDSLLAERDVGVTVPPDLYVHCDAVLIEQLLINLLENAVKHTPAHTPLELAAALVDGELVIEVRDRGPGLEPSEAGAAFDKFQRRPGSSGMGVGLTICRAIATVHGGRVWVESRAGGGAIFKLALPRAQSATLSDGQLTMTERPA